MLLKTYIYIIIFNLWYNGIVGNIEQSVYTDKEKNVTASNIISSCRAFMDSFSIVCNKTILFNCHVICRVIESYDLYLKLIFFHLYKKKAVQYII